MRIVRRLFRAPWKESSGYLPWLIVAAVLVAFWTFLPGEHDALSWLKDNKDPLSALSSIVTLFGIAIAGLLSYLRFFRGRWLFPKMTVSLEAGAIAMENENLVWIDVALENKGTVAIWNPKTTIRATLHHSDGSKSAPIDVVDFYSFPPDWKAGDYLIDVGETAFDHAVLRVAKSVSAITLFVESRDQNGAMWSRGMTFANCTDAGRSVLA
ncbi:MAG TPA: hypothetical protein VG889_12025 [Rhizomicrobium sp.]|nr:hypothetical protein [Rhizomicrobium sp.]